MASVFTAVPWPPKGFARPKRGTDAAAHPPPSSDNDADGAGDETPDLRDLNAALRALADVFPHVRPEVFREMVLSVSETSRVEVITEMLLKQGAKWIRGRYRMPSEHDEHPLVLRPRPRYKYRRDGDNREDSPGRPLALADTFRSPSYHAAVKEALYQEFKGLSHSTIRAVLAEYNSSYTAARPTLLGLVEKSWRASIAHFIMRRKAPSAGSHPLLQWTSPDPKTGQPAVPKLARTKSSELDKELYDALILPLLEKQRLQQIARDRALALSINEEQADQAGELYDCECCFTPSTLEQLSTCNAEAHYICFRCIRLAIAAALYDQGWARNMDSARCTLRCIAPVTHGTDECGGSIASSLVERALLEEPDGRGTWQKVQERLANEAILKSQLPLIRCPFCVYAEIDGLAASPTGLPSITFKPIFSPATSLPPLSALYSTALRICLQILFSLLTFLYAIPSLLSGPCDRSNRLRSAMYRVQLKRRGLRFQCQSSTCGRASCVQCGAAWHDPHQCYSSLLTSLRLTLERATTDAIKRTCPVCNLSFVKTVGCNKLVCLCGYRMCYLCRQRIDANDGYKHFCQHFRDPPGAPCALCDRCDLYRDEDDEVVVKHAREVAEREWWARQGQDVQGRGVESLKCAAERTTRSRRWDQLVDWLIDAVVE